MDYKRIVPFAAVMVIYLAYPIIMISSYENVLEEGIAYRFRPIPVDPVDAFRGRYVTLSFNNLRAQFPDAINQLNYGEEVFATVAEDSLGFAYFNGASLLPPATGSNYIKTYVRQVDSNEVFLATPENMRRFYVNEAIAPAVEKRYREMVRNNRNSQSMDSIAYLSVRVLKGRVISEALYLGGERIGIKE
ncbi:MAG: GDYXXLXY domain-containing protein [Bacteroidota bacterium]